MKSLTLKDKKITHIKNRVAFMRSNSDYVKKAMQNGPSTKASKRIKYEINFTKEGGKSV